MKNKRYKRKRRLLKSNEVSELPFKVFEQKLKKAGITSGIYRIKN